MFILISLFTSCSIFNKTFKDRKRDWIVSCVKEIGGEIGGASIEITEACLHIIKEEHKYKKLRSKDE